MKSFSKLINIVLTIIIGFMIYTTFLFIINNVNLIFDPVSANPFLLFIIIICAIIITFIMAVIIHEFGHYVFGKITRYKLVYFRIFNFIFMGKDNKTRFNFASSNAIIGQCLMSPNFELSNNIPYVLYNAGGSIFNFLAAIISVVLIYLFPYMALVVFLLFLFIFNTMLCFFNIYPKVSHLPNDGYNIKMIRKSSFYKEVYYNLLKITEKVISGERFKDIKELINDFKIDDIYQFPHLQTLSLYKYFSLVDNKQYDEAFELLMTIDDNSNKMLPHYLNIFKNEYFIFVSLYQNDMDKALSIYQSFSPQLVAFVKKSNFDNYAIARLILSIYTKSNNEEFFHEYNKTRQEIEKSFSYGEIPFNLTRLELVKQLFDNLNK